MFYYLEGKTALLEPNLAVIDCGGVGYAVNTTANTISKLHTGENARLYTYVNVREDAIDIFGFASMNEKHSFELLLSGDEIQHILFLLAKFMLPNIRTLGFAHFRTGDKSLFKELLSECFGFFFRSDSGLDNAKHKFSFQKMSPL